MPYYKENYIKPAARLGLHHTPMQRNLEAALVTYKKGCPLISASGYVDHATSAAISTHTLIGFSAEDGNNDSSAGDHSISYIPATPAQEFVAAVNGTLAQSHLFTAYGLAYDTASETWVVDLDESSASQKCVTITGFKDEVGTANGLVYFVVNGTGRLIG